MKFLPVLIALAVPALCEKLRGTSEIKSKSFLPSLGLNWEAQCSGREINATDCNYNLGQVADSHGWMHTREKMETCLQQCQPGFSDVRPFRCKLDLANCCVYKICSENFLEWRDDVRNGNN